jgi:hypothetical protein
MNELAAWVREGLVEAVMWIVPIAGAALAASVVAGWLATRLGLHDPALGLLLRAAAVFAAVLSVGSELAERSETFAGDAWSRLPALGRGVDP